MRPSSMPRLIRTTSYWFSGPSWGKYWQRQGWGTMATTQGEKDATSGVAYSGTVRVYEFKTMMASPFLEAADGIFWGYANYTNGKVAGDIIGVRRRPHK